MDEEGYVGTYFPDRASDEIAKRQMQEIGRGPTDDESDKLGDAP